jgi:catechol 2,3-dioxygenase-like lactoylglutathione lyase family enzyme
MATTSEKTYSVGGVRLERPFKLRRLGHFGFNVTKMDECIHFYRSLLGFKQSDTIDFAAIPARAELLKKAGITDGKGAFFRYGTDHHAFVLFPRPALEAMRGGPTEVNINQITWQTGSLAEVVNGVEYFQDHDVQVVRSGRDMPGSNWHTYILDPDGHTNELYYGMEQVGWQGRSKPREMAYRRFTEVATLPQMPEEEEIEEAKAKGIDIEVGFRDLEDMPTKYDVEGVLLARPFSITKIGPVNIFVDNVDASVDFYTSRLGFKLTEDVNHGGRRVAFLRVGTEHHSLGLFPKSMRPELGVTENSTNASFGVCVGNHEQLRNAVSFLKENGVRFVEWPEELQPGIDYSAYALDPEGHAIQLYSYMEQVGWQGEPRPRVLHGKSLDQWPETVGELSDSFADQQFQGPLG